MMFVSRGSTFETGDGTHERPLGVQSYTNCCIQLGPTCSELSAKAITFHTRIALRSPLSAGPMHFQLGKPSWITLSKCVTTLLQKMRDTTISFIGPIRTLVDHAWRPSWFGVHLIVQGVLRSSPEMRSVNSANDLSSGKLACGLDFIRERSYHDTWWLVISTPLPAQAVR